MNDRDYAAAGMTIQQAMLDFIRTRERADGGPPKIRWGDRVVQTSDCIAVSPKGRFRIEFLSARGDRRQGVDVKVSGGIRLADGENVGTLRTWDEPRYERVVEYEYQSPDGKLWVWNVYEVVHPGGQVETLKWTGNAGFWAEDTQGGRTYHCSAGTCSPPDFEALVFKITLL